MTYPPTILELPGESSTFLSSSPVLTITVEINDVSDPRSSVVAATTGEDNLFTSTIATVTEAQ